MKLLLENWRKYIKEVEAFDDIATTPEQIQQSIDWFYTSPKFDRGEKKGEESWNGHVIITYGLPKGDEFHFVVNKDGKPVAYVASAPFRDGHAVGNIRKNTKDFYATDLYNWMTNKYGVLYSDKAQTKDGAGIWERFPNKEKVETEKEDGKGRWRYRIGKEVNEIFGFGKKKKKADLGVEDLTGLSYDIDRIGGYIDTIKNTSGDFAKLHLEQLIKVYEENVDPMISRLMIAKSQIDKETHELESSIEKKIRDYKNLYVVSWEDEADLLRQLLEIAYNLRNKILGAYKRYRNKAPELPAYKPKPGIHDLEKLMGTAKER